MYTASVDTENPPLIGQPRHSRIQADSSDESMTEIQVHHRDEVLKRLANFKEKTSDVFIEPIPA